MTTELQVREPSHELRRLIEDAAETLWSFAEKWGQIKTLGIKQGFTEKELQDMTRPFLKEKVDSKKIWYLFHSDEQKERDRKYRAVTRTKLSTNDVDNDTEQSKNDHGNEIASDEPLYTMVKSTSGLEGTVELDPATDVMNKLQELTRDNENLRKELHDEREILAKLSVTTADKQDANMDQLFDMLPNDDIDTFKNKNGTTLLFERLLVNFKYQKIPKLQWWVRVIK